jgi:hypothetical protein
MDLIEKPLKDPINHWYYHMKFRAIQKALKNVDLNSSLLIDIGAGSALFSKQLSLLHTGLRVIAVDVNYKTEIEMSTNTFEYVTEVPPGKGNVFLLNDVLEHIEDDFGFLSKIVQEAPKSSLFVITVPAMMSLWSSHDEFLKHFRRYHRAEVEQLCELSGLSGRKGQYLYGLFYPFAFFQRKLDLRPHSSKSKLVEASPIINTLIKRFSRADYLLSKALPFGVSYITIKSS